MFVPDAVRLSDDMITWETPTPRPRSVDPDPPWRRRLTWPNNRKRFNQTALLKFVELHSGPSQAIADFASRHGVFGARRLTDSEPPQSNEVFCIGQRWLISGRFIPPNEEPVSLWRSLSRKAQAILRINSALKKGSARSPLPAWATNEDWAALLDIGIDVAGLRSPDEPIEEAQFLLSQQINDWLRSAGVGFKLAPLEWSKNHTTWKVEVGFLDGYNLFGALAYSIFQTVAGEENLYVCDACNQIYIRTQRLPRPGQENFCSEECQKISIKRATQRYRMSKKGSKK